MLVGRLTGICGRVNGSAKGWARLLGLVLALSCVAAGRLLPVPAQAAEKTVEVGFSMTPGPAINPQIFGVNYVWHQVPATEFSLFTATMYDQAHTTLMRYPGGWAAEWYDWDNNVEIENGKVRDVPPGVDPKTFLAAVPNASFVTPSASAIRDPSQIGAVVNTSVKLVNLYGSQVKTWEIGNEWWLQRNAKTNPTIREQNLSAYAALVKVVAPAMKKANPAIDIYATGDWTQPKDFATLRSLVGPEAWAAVTGISVHPYCGDQSPETLCVRMSERAAEIRALTGKEKIYASEWSLGVEVNDNNYGIRNANQMVAAVQSLAFAKFHAASYWPPVKAVPAIVFVSANYEQIFATGDIFGWMAQAYRGHVLTTTGPLPAAAARSGQQVTLFIPSMDNGQIRVLVPLARTGLSQVVKAEVMFAANTDDHNRARVAQVKPLPTQVVQLPSGDLAVSLTLNPGSPGRGSAWEIARITLK